MGKKTRIETNSHECSRCGSVSFRTRLIDHYADEGMLLATVVDQIIDYGRCQVQANARVPGHAVHDELVHCPVYSEIDKR